MPRALRGRPVDFRGAALALEARERHLEGEPSDGVRREAYQSARASAAQFSLIGMTTAGPKKLPVIWVLAFSIPSVQIPIREA